MSTTASSDTGERFMLDAASFEKFLAAAWVLQSRHDEVLLTLQRNLRKTNTASSGIQKTEPALDLQLSMKATTGCLSILPDIEDKPEVPQRPREMEPVRIELKPLDPKLHEHPEDAAVLRAVDGEPAVCEMLGAKKAVAKLKSSADPRAAFSKLYRAFNNYQRTFRINLPLPAIRSVAIAAPILGLAILSGLLLLATWRHEATHGAQVISQPSAAPTEGAITGGSQTLGVTTQNASQDFGKATNPASPQLSSNASLRMSHLRVTDSATASVVRELSSHEIRGLRHRARYGDASAAFSLGMAYETGRHLHQNCVEAARWVAKAAAAGNAAAQYNLGLRYQTGDGVRANSAQSRKWLRKAARRNPNAKHALELLALR